MSFKVFTCLLSVFLFQEITFAKGANHSLAISQGISHPTSTSTVNYTNGFTSENPVGATYQDSIRLTGQYASGGGNSNAGIELGVGDGSYGFALGHQDNGGTGSTAGILAGVLGGVGFGLRFQENISTLGLLFNPNGGSRVGVVAGINNPTGNNNNITTIGVGYANIGSKFTFAIDASTRIYEDTTVVDDTILVTPGLALYFSMLSISLSYDLYVNLPAASTSSNDLWWGIGIDGGNSWDIALYSNYASDFSFVGSLYF